jgi:hypothetical protein
MSQRYENTLRKVVAFFFYKRQAGVTPSYNALVHRWEKLWFPKEMTAYDLAVEQHEGFHGNYATFSNLAVSALMKFYEDFSKRIGDPVMLDEKFFVPLSKEIKLEGRFDLVLQFRDTFYVIKWSSSARRLGMSNFIMDFAALKHAFEYRNRGRKYNVVYRLYDVGSQNPGFIEVEPTDDEVNALVYWAHDINDTRAFVPRRGLTAYCKKCPHDTPCSKFVFPTVNTAHSSTVSY